MTLLQPFQPGRILSSPFVRCVQTVEPLAHRLRVKVEEVDELAEGQGEDAVSLLAERSTVPLPVVLAAARQLEERRLAVREGLDLVLTDEGREVAGKLAKAR